MAVARQTEHSVLTSLSELRAIEEERVADERAAVQAAHLARIAAREAEERALADAAAAKIREMHEAALAIEQAKVEAEREARLKIEATEAAERTRQQAILAETRLAQEMELRRAEVAKKRPTWMVAVTAVAILAAFALIYVAIDRTRTSEQAKERARIAMAQEREMRHQLEELTTSLVSLQGELDTLSGRTNKAIDDLAKADNAAQAAAAKKEIDRLRAEERGIRQRQEQIRIDKERIERKKKIKLDEKCLTQAIC
jgi:hypothetical protein